MLVVVIDPKTNERWYFRSMEQTAKALNYSPRIMRNQFAKSENNIIFHKGFEIRREEFLTGADKLCD